MLAEEIDADKVQEEIKKAVEEALAEAEKVQEEKLQQVLENIQQAEKEVECVLIM